MTRIQNPLDKCDFKQKFNALWHRAYSAIRFINGKGVEDGEGSVTLTAEDIPDVQPLLTAGENITIEDNVISATGGSVATWGNITGTLTDQTDLKNALDDKADASDVYTKAQTYDKQEVDFELSYINSQLSSKADQISVDAAVTILNSVKQNKLTAGTNITIDANNVISASGGSITPVWGNITGTLTDQSDLKNALDAKANTSDVYNKTHVDSEVQSLTEFINSVSAGVTALDNNTYKKTYIDTQLAGKQPTLTAGTNITIDANNVISASGGSITPVWGNITGTLTDQSDLKDALDDKADVASVESIEDEIGVVGQAGTIRNDISLVNDRVDSVEDEIGPETTAGTLRYKIKENSNDIISIENEIDIIDGIIASHSTAINGKADKTYVDNELANKADSSALTNHINNTSNPHQVSKAQVGLANVDNTSDANKPISTATQNAINAINDKFEITNTFVAMSSIISGCEGSMYITQILPKVYIVSLIDIRRSAGFSATTVYTFPSPNRNTPRAILGDDNGNHGLAYMAYNSPDLIVRYSGGNTYASEQMVVILQ